MHVRGEFKGEKLHGVTGGTLVSTCINQVLMYCMLAYVVCDRSCTKVYLAQYSESGYTTECGILGMQLSMEIGAMVAVWLPWL